MIININEEERIASDKQCFKVQKKKIDENGEVEWRNAGLYYNTLEYLFVDLFRRKIKGLDKVEIKELREEIKKFKEEIAEIGRNIEEELKEKGVI